ncbi:MAG: hypothetical protein GF308_20920 [Candidatus Heimdallarchaeota archaeon]|nr:hypothetical protein [Candidatus Heimdallarchaeota archaeon]
MLKAGLERVREELKNKDFELAKNLLGQLIQISLTERDLTTTAFALMILGETFKAEKKFSDALISFHQSLEFAFEARELSLGLEALVEISNSYFILEQFPKALDYSKKVISLLQKKPDNKKSFKIYNILLLIYWKKGAFKKAIQIINQIDDIPSEEVLDDYLFAFNYNAAQILRKKRRLKKAIRYFERSIRILGRKEQEDEEALGRAYCDLAEIHVYHESYELAETLISKGIELLSSYHLELFHAYLLYSKILTQLKKFKLAEEMLNKAEKLFPEKSKNELAAYFYYFKGLLKEQSILNKNDETNKDNSEPLKECVDFYLQGLKASQALEQNFELSLLLRISLLRNYIRQDSQKAMENIKQIIIQAVDKKNDFLEIVGLLIKALLLGQMGDYDSFAEILTIAEKKIEQKDTTERISQLKQVFTEAETVISMQREVRDTFPLENGPGLILDLIYELLNLPFASARKEHQIFFY